MASPVTLDIKAQWPGQGVFSAACLFRHADNLVKTFGRDIGKAHIDEVAITMGLVVPATAPRWSRCWIPCRAWS